MQKKTPSCRKEIKQEGVWRDNK